MKIQAITWKWINLFLLLLALLGYQYVQAGRAAAEEAAKLQNQIDILAVEKEEMQEALVLLEEAVQGSASGAAQAGDDPGNAVSNDGTADPGGGGGTASNGGDGAGGYADGIRQGTAMGFGGDITVEVTVESGALKEISVVQAEFEDKEYMDMAMKMIPEMVETGSPEVDVVTGATLSSIGLRDAVQAALQAGMQ